MPTFWMDGETVALHADQRADGGVLHIDCRQEDGLTARLRLNFTSEGVDRFSEIVSKFVHSCQEARREAEGDQRTPAAEPTSAGAQDAEGRRIHRYRTTRIHPHELELLVTVMKTHDGTAAPEYSGTDRVVIWRTRDERGEEPGETSCRLYLSPGAVKAAGQDGIQLEFLGEVSSHDLPDNRQLLVGDPPLDWQDTSFAPEPAR
jgi:hypothetical protein